MLSNNSSTLLLSLLSSFSRKDRKFTKGKKKMRREIHGADIASESSLLDKETQDSSATTNATTALLFTTFVAVSGSFVFGSAVSF